METEEAVCALRRPLSPGRKALFVFTVIAAGGFFLFFFYAACLALFG
jgi:hypothetical protein